MSAEFVPLAVLLRPRAAPAPADAPSELPPDDAVRDDAPAVPDAGEPSCEEDGVRAALRDARLFRARLADAVDAAVPRLLRDLAARVLARELRAAPCEIDAVVGAAAAGAPVVRVRVAPGEAHRVHGVAVSEDPQLAHGDAVVEIDGGAVDARLGVRLATVLEAFA